MSTRRTSMREVIATTSYAVRTGPVANQRANQGSWVTKNSRTGSLVAKAGIKGGKRA
jgi:hypothetical protein